MPLSHDHIRTTVETYLAHHPHERPQLSGVLEALDRPTDITSRSTFSGHVTCGAIVVDHLGRVLHVLHRASGKVLAPGGHTEPEDESLAAAALRELYEETGIPPQAVKPWPGYEAVPLDIDIHDINAHPGKSEPSHQHFDFRFAFYISAEQLPPLRLQDEEVSGAQWLAFADVRSPTLRAKLLDAEASGLAGQPEPVNASALLHDGHGRYLLHLRDLREGIWEPGVFSLLGGGRERGDRCLEGTLRRELAEEAPGLEPVGLAPYAVEEATSVDGLAVPIQVYTGRWNGHPDTVDLQEGVLLHWFTLDMLDRSRLSPGLGDLIRRHAAEYPPAGSPPDHIRPLHEVAPEGTELHIVGVHLHLQDEHGRILLGLRHPDSAFAPNEWHFLAGYCEREAAVSCLVRKARKQAGLIIDSGDVELVHVVHHIDSPKTRARIALVFRARTWSGTPQILEPDRCVEWRWFRPQDLPAAVVPYTRLAIEGIGASCPYTQTGW